MAGTIYLKGSPGYYSLQVPIHVEGATAPVLFRVREMSDEVAQQWEVLQEKQIDLLRSVGAEAAPAAIAKAGDDKRKAQGVLDRVLDAFVEQVLTEGSSMMVTLRDLRRETDAMMDCLVADGLVQFPQEVRDVDENGTESTPPVNVETVKRLPRWIREKLQQAILNASGLSQGEQDFLVRLLAP